MNNRPGAGAFDKKQTVNYMFLLTLHSGRALVPRVPDAAMSVVSSRFPGEAMPSPFARLQHAPPACAYPVALLPAEALQPMCKLQECRPTRTRLLPPGLRAHSLATKPARVLLGMPKESAPVFGLTAVRP